MVNVEAKSIVAQLLNDTNWSAVYDIVDKGVRQDFPVRKLLSMLDTPHITQISQYYELTYLQTKRVVDCLVVEYNKKREYHKSLRTGVHTYASQSNILWFDGY